MSSARQEEIIRKGFLKSLIEGTLELKDLAGINVDLDMARQAYLQGVQETTQALIELVKENMATAAKQDLQATEAKQEEILTRLDDLIALAEAEATAWSVINAVYVQEGSVAAEDGSPQGFWFSPDGSKMYMVGSDDDRVEEYNLTTSWNVSTLVHVDGMAVGAKDNTPTGVFLNPAGTKLYVIGSQNDDIHEYNLGTPFDITTNAFVQSQGQAEDTGPADIYFRSDGEKMYMVGENGQDVNEYTLGVAWDISTLAYVRNFSVAAQEAAPSGLYFKPDGYRMYVIGTTGDDINEYHLSTAWDISTAVHNSLFSFAAKELNGLSIFWKPDGTKVYILGATGNDVTEYDV